MAKKTLEDKIKDIVFYATVFFILYLIIGFLIKSEWLTSFTQSCTYAYELLRDALTLTAYFLAPVAAFVLFTDWREQHKAIKLDRFDDEMSFKILNLYSNSEDIFYDMATRSKNLDNFRELIALKYLNFNNELEELKNKFYSFSFSDDQVAQNYKEQISELLHLFDITTMQLFVMKSSLLRLIYDIENLSDEDKKIKLMHFNSCKDTFIKTNDRIQEMLDSLDQLRPKI